jgi:hypothetical protein
VASSVVVKMHDAELRALLQSEQGPVAKDLMARGRRVESCAKGDAPVRYGRLRSSITVTPVTVDGEFTVWVSSNVVYAPFAHRSGQRAAHYLEDALRCAK